MHAAMQIAPDLLGLGAKSFSLSRILLGILDSFRVFVLSITQVLHPSNPSGYSALNGPYVFCL